MWLSLLLLIVIPAVLLLDLFRARHPNRGDWMLSAGFTGAYLLFVSLVGRWDFFSTYLPWLYFLLYLLALYLPSRRPAAATLPTASGHERRRVPDGRPREGTDAAPDAADARAAPRGARRRVSGEAAPLRASPYLRAGVSLSMVALLVGSWIAYSGRAWSDDIPSLVFPLGEGTYFIGAGGGSGLINGHHGDPAQEFALDIVKLNPWGARAVGIAPRTFERHEIFGEVVRSPCAATVLDALDGHPDRPPRVRTPFTRADTRRESGPSARSPGAADSPPPASASADGEASPAGNHVVLECEGREGSKVVLARMQEGSVLVTAGDAVRMGDPLGRVGNSGKDGQPHLHIHVERGGSPTGALDGEAVQVQYEGRFLVRGQVFRSVDLQPADPTRGES